MSRVALIQQQFHLEEDPFNPGRDPKGQLDFKRAPLTKELDLFRFQELARFYSRVGCFGVAARAAEARLKNADFSSTREFPPVVLIQGNNGEGKTSLASYVASLLKEASPDAALKRFELPSQHFGKALLQIATILSERLSSIGIGSQLKERLGRVDIKDPDEDYLKSSLESAASDIVDFPPLIIVVERLGYGHADWPKRLHRVVRMFGVLLIFVTDAQGDLVTALFEQDLKNQEFDGIALKVEGLSRDQAGDFLLERFRLFRRADAPPNRTGLFPLFEQELDQAFTGQQRLRIRLLLKVMTDAFNGKVDGAQRSVADAYAATLRNVNGKPGATNGK